MTTIAYNHKDKQIAVDSRVTSSGVVMSDNDNKVQTKGDVMFILAGSISDKEKFVSQYPDIKDNYDCDGFTIEKGKVYGVCVEDKVLYKSELNYNDATGSGFRFALAAMDFGKTAREAVKYAATRCIYTGGKIKVINIK